MKPTDKEAIEVLQKLTRGHAVIYLREQPSQAETPPYAVTTSGVNKQGRPWFALGDEAHFINPDYEAVLHGKDVGVAYYENNKLKLYVTRAIDAPEIDPGQIVSQIEEARATLGEDGLGEIGRIADLE